MDRVATEVAKPPTAGGDLPGFEELLAKGSFHARLAQARVARERALAESGSADDFILNTSRKPWDRDDDTPKPDGRRVVTLAATAAPSNVTRLRAEWAPAGRAGTAAERPADGTIPFPAGAARRLHLVPPAALPEVPPVDPVPLRRRIAVVSGGFGIGLAIGAVLAFGILSLVGPQAGSAPAASRAPEVHRAPATPETAAAPHGAAPVVAPVAAPVDFVPARRVLARLAPAQGRDGAFASTDPPAAPAAFAGFVPMVPEVRAELEQSPVSRPAAVSPPPGARPGLPALPAAAPPEAGPHPLRFTARPLRPVDRAPVLDPAGETGSANALDAFLPQPEVVPATARMAPLAGTPMAPDAGLPAQSAPVAAGPRDPGPVLVHAPASLSDSELGALVERLGAEGFVLAAPARVRVTVRQSNVRFFHPEDAGAAAAVAAVLGVALRDFTDFSPAPPAGTIEVWLAGHDTASASAQGSGPRKARQAATRSGQTELEALRDRILWQLRNGEHL